MRLVGALSVAILAVSSCVTTPLRRRTLVEFAVPATSPPAAANAAPSVSSVIVVTLDGARWQDIFGPAELMPTLHRWMTLDGVGIGAPGHGEIRSSGPAYVSLPA